MHSSGREIFNDSFQFYGSGPTKLMRLSRQLPCLINHIGVVPDLKCD